MDEKPRLTRYTQTESLTRNPETMLLQLSLLVGALAGLLLVFFGIRRWRRRGRRAVAIRGVLYGRGYGLHVHRDRLYPEIHPCSPFKAKGNA